MKIKNEKILRLINDDRSFKDRLTIAFTVSFGTAFTFILFSVLDLFILNRSDFIFVFADIVGQTFIVFLTVLVLILFVMMLFKGKLFDIISSLIFGILLAGYIQGNFLNLNLGNLTGDMIPWSKYKGHALVNFLIWILIIMLPIVILYFNKNIWKKIIVIVPIVLVVMQSVALVLPMLTTDVLTERSVNRLLSDKGLYGLSDKENVIVIILDRLDGKYIDGVIKDDPSFFDNLDGFTYYGNTTSSSIKTFPSIPYMLTGKLSLYEEPGSKFLKKAWNDSTFIPKLRENNFTTKLFIDYSYAYSDINQLEGQADNIISSGQKVNSWSAVEKLAILSGYKNAPHFFKPTFWITTEEFSNLVIAKDKNGDKDKDKDKVKVFNGSNFEFYDNILENGLTINEDKNNFTFVHLTGVHNLTINAKAQEVPHGETSYKDATKGCFKILDEYFRQMKELGVYDSSTIIVAGDHGTQTAHGTPLDQYKTAAFFMKTKNATSKKIIYSDIPVSHENFQATILEAAGIDSTGYGESIFNLDEHSNKTRTFYYYVDGDREKNKDYIFEEFEIKGDARDFKNWTKIKDHIIKYPYG